ncbi:MAG: ABC transporter permease subunit, partial [Deltaproteobacteria bacterium]
GSPSPWQGHEFRVCADAKVPLARSSALWHQLYGLFLAMVTFAIVFGAFAGNVIFGAMKAVPHAQLETAEAYGLSRRQTFWRILVPQMWVYALPGLTNLWLILIKASPLLFLLGVRDIVYWAKELGGTKTQAYEYPHGDWRLYYLLALLVFFLVMTWASEKLLTRLTRRLSHGQATLGGEELRKATL